MSLPSPVPPLPKTLKELLDQAPPNLRTLFVRVLNQHAGYQIKPLDGKQLVAQIRKQIEESLDA